LLVHSNVLSLTFSRMRCMFYSLMNSTLILFILNFQGNGRSLSPHGRNISSASLNASKITRLCYVCIYFTRFLWNSLSLLSFINSVWNRVSMFWKFLYSRIFSAGIPFKYAIDRSNCEDCSMSFKRFYYKILSFSRD